MRNIFDFVWKNYFFFLFLILQVFCFTLIIQNNNYHKAAFINKTNDFFGAITQRVDNIYAYFSLKETNLKLAEENARLHTESFKSFRTTDKKIFEVNDTIYRQKYNYIEAKVINNSTNKRKNYITLDKGKRHGIRKDMGVIASDGIVGIVTGVSTNFSTVMPVVNINTKISAKIRHNNHIGSLVWGGTDYRKAYLEDIPLHVVFEAGDTIVTSGFSAIFPEGIFAGTIIESSYDGSESFYKISIELAVDFNKLSHVYVVDNIMKAEQLLLEKQNQKQ